MKRARAVLFAMLALAAAGCGYRDPVKLVEDYFGLEIAGKYAKKHALIHSSLDEIEPRKAFVEQHESWAVGRKLVKVEVLNKPGEAAMWRAWVRLTWQVGPKAEQKTTRGVTAVRRSGRWYILDTPAARVEANEAYVAGDPGRATRILQRIVRANPMDAEALDLLGYVLRDNSTLKNNLELAVEMHRRAIELEPGNADWHLSLGNDYRLIGWYEGAVAELKKSAELSPKSTTYVWLGVALAASKKIPAAREAWRTALKRDATNAQAHAYLEKTR